MSPFIAAAFSLAIFAGIGGASILIFHKRILTFVRDRFAKVHHEDALTEAESARRSPKLWMVVTIGLGWLVVAAIAACAGWVGAGGASTANHAVYDWCVSTHDGDTAVCI